MKVEYHIDELLIVPETEFEEQVLSQFRSTKAFLKCGISPKEIVGFLIRKVECEPDSIKVANS